MGLIQWIKRLFSPATTKPPSTPLCQEDRQFASRYEKEHALIVGQNSKGERVTIIKMAPVEKARVLAKDTKDVDDIVSGSAEELQRLGDAQPWNLTISGYDTDPRALFEVPEVRDWCALAMERHPCLFGILSQASISWLFPCLVNVEVKQKQRRDLSPLEQEIVESAKSTIAQRDGAAAAAAFETCTTGTASLRITATPEELVRLQLKTAIGIAAFYVKHAPNPQAAKNLANVAAQRIHAATNLDVAPLMIAFWPPV